MSLPLRQQAQWALSQLKTLQREYHEFNPPVVPTYPYPTAVEFARQVTTGLPCVYDVFAAESSASEGPEGVVNGESTARPRPGRWPACSWTAEDLVAKVEGEMAVAATPDGKADALVTLPSGERVFVQPATVGMGMGALLARLASAPRGSTKTQTTTKMGRPVYYLQSQNSNLTTETPLRPLLADLRPNFDFAAAVLGEPDARNVWVGDERSVTSVHRDPYENLYLVVRGEKRFRVWAPVEEVELGRRVRWVRGGRYVMGEDGGGWDVVMDEEEREERVPWVDFDPLVEEGEGAGGMQMREVRVKAGQVLYLPGGWYHHVSQACGVWADGSRAPCVAVNYWYDMCYEGERYVMRQMMGRLVEMVREGDDGGG